MSLRCKKHSVWQHSLLNFKEHLQEREKARGRGVCVSGERLFFIVWNCAVLPTPATAFPPGTPESPAVPDAALGPESIATPSVELM